MTDSLFPQSGSVPAEARRRCHSCGGQGGHYTDLDALNRNPRFLHCSLCQGRGWFDSRYVFDFIPEGRGYRIVRKAVA